MKRILYLIALALLAFLPSFAENASEDADFAKLKERIYSIKDTKKRLDAAYNLSRDSINTTREVYLLGILYDLASKENKEDDMLYALRNAMRCMYNLDYPIDSLLPKYHMLAEMKLDTKNYHYTMIDAMSFLCYSYIFTADYVKVFDLTNELMTYYPKDNYGEMKACQMLSLSYSEQFQDSLALEYAKRAYDLSKGDYLDRSYTIYMGLDVLNGMNITKEYSDMKPYLDEMYEIMEKEDKSTKTEIEVNYITAMLGVYSLCYYVDAKELDKAKEYYDYLERDSTITLYAHDMCIYRTMMSRYALAKGDKEKAWEWVEEEYPYPPLSYRKQQVEVLAAMGRWKEAYEKANTIAYLVEEFFNQSFAAQITEMEAKYKLFNLESERNQMLIYFIISIAVLFIVIVVLFVVLYVRQRQYSAKIKRANETQTIFLQNMSHELRTPLNAICGFSQLLTNPEMREFISAEEMVQYGNIIKGNTDMLSTLVGDILDVSDMESGKYRLNVGECRANDICQNAVNTVSYRCPDHIKLYYTTEVDDEFTIMSDSQRCQQIIINFLTNAIKHTAEGEIHVHTSLKETPGMLTFSVTDTGEGVPAEKAELIFGRFEKLDTFKQGTGLGLSICRQLAERLGGYVKLDTSYTAGGARFVFVHPLSE